ncbi:MAG TPA: shikimate kinase [Campylobacterales bacterium]|nr:shikimate kinase [Campylobacterales bacterium]
MKNIILIGFMGVGKGTVARAYATEFDAFAIDTDDLIESMENRKIKNIFEEEGEPYFRDLEQKCAKWLSKSVENSIISTGGGFFKTKSIKKIGTVVLLDSSYEAIYQRILAHPNAKKKLAKRPLFQDPKQAKKLYKERSAEYKEVADIVVNVEDKTPFEVAQKIQELI